jgi:predicted transcriptional regulator
MLGEQLHVCWHPTAKGQMPAKAQAAPVVALDALKPGQTSPNVIVVPVACCGKVPAAVRGSISKQIVKNSPDVVVWLDFSDAMKNTFGLTMGEANVVVIDATGFARMKLNGVIDQPSMDKLVKTVQTLRYEAVK